jgi:hypothetical protein
MSGRAPQPWRLTLVAVFLLAWLAPTAAQATKTRHAAILARALSYELTLEERVGATVSVAVLYKKGDRSSEANADDWIEAFRDLKSVRIKDRPLTASKIAYSPADTLTAIVRDGADVLLVADGLGADLEEIARIARTRHVLTASNAVSDVAKELTLCVTEEADKVKIVINLNAAHLEGIRFSSNLLKLATLIR